MRRLTALWRAPSALHLVGLAICLLALLPLVKPGRVLFSDEGAPILQERLLRSAHSWVESTSPLPLVDPLGVARTIPNADVGAKGRAPYAKHPAYPLVLGAFDDLFGAGGILALGIAGTVLAAAAAAALAVMVDRRLARPAIWITGLSSPLLFDSYIVVAHTVAAASATVAAIGLLAAVQGRRWRWGGAFLTVIGVVITSLLRTEGALWGGALAAAGLVLLGSRRTSARLATLAASAGSVGAVLVVRRAEAALLVRHVGAAVASRSGPDPTPSAGILNQRIHGLARTVFAPGYVATSRQALILGAAALLVAAAGILARRSKSADFVAVALLAAAILSLARFFLGSASLVPGILVAFPTGVFALGMLSKRDVEHDWQVAVISTLVVFAATVVATQYAKGGGVEWGGRYFAISLPMASVLVAGVLRRHFTHVPRQAAVAQVLALSASTAAVSALGLAALGQTHERTRQLGQVLAEAAAVSAEAGRPTVVLTSQRFLPQIEWQLYTHLVWLTPTNADLIDIANRLGARPPGPVLLIAGRPDTTLAAISGSWRAGHTYEMSKVPGLEIVGLQPVRSG